MKYVPWALLALVAVAFFVWGFPAYKRITLERDALKTENDKIKSETHTVIVKVPVDIDGHISFRTTLTRDSIRTDDKTSVDKTKEYSQTTTKRGMFTIMAYVNLKTELAGSVSYQVLGPVNIGASFANGQPYLGAGLSF